MSRKFVAEIPNQEAPKKTVALRVPQRAARARIPVPAARVGLGMRPQWRQK
jgi:hypothetical protein